MLADGETACLFVRIVSAFINESECQQPTKQQIFSRIQWGNRMCVFMILVKLNMNNLRYDVRYNYGD